MSISENIQTVLAIKKITMGGEAELSLAEIASALLNIREAKNNLPPEQYQAVYSLFMDIQKQNKKTQYDIDSYKETALVLIKFFDAVAPYEKYSGNEAGWAPFMNDIRNHGSLHDNRLLGFPEDNILDKNDYMLTSNQGQNKIEQTAFSNNIKPSTNVDNKYSYGKTTLPYTFGDTAPSNKERIPNSPLKVNREGGKTNISGIVSGIVGGLIVIAIIIYIILKTTCALGHSWMPASCTEPKTCSVCGAIEGPALGHSWVYKNSNEPPVCQRCGSIKPLALPRSGKVFIGSQKICDSELTINSSSDSSCYVKLKDEYGRTVFSFFVRAGAKVTVPVPTGKFYVYFAYGDDWYGKDMLFGDETRCAKDDELLDFSEYTWSFTLYPVSDGNFTETPISVDEF